MLRDSPTMPPSPYDTIGSSSVGSRPSQKNGPQYFAVFAATLGNLVMGTTIAWSSPAGPLLQLPRDQDGFSLTTEQVSWVGCLMPAGALLGGQVGGLLMSRMGRKGGMMICAGMFSLSLLLLAAASNAAMVYVARMLCGVCTGVTSIICPNYVAEVSTADKRGLLGSCVQVMVTLGVLEVIVVGVVGSWRWLTISCLVLTLAWAAAVFFIPESPVHYISLKRYSEAREALEWLRGTNEVEMEYEEIVRGVEEAARNSQGAGLGPGKLLEKGNLAPFLISMTLMLGQQLSGMNAVMFYAVSIFEEAKSGLNSIVENIIVAIFQVVSCIAAAAFMDKLGRRILLIISAFLMLVSAGLLGMYFYIADNLGNTELAAKLHVIPVISLSVFVSAFSVGFGPIPWLMMSELFSSEVKSIASSLSTSFNWTLAFFVTKFFSNMVAGVTEAGAFWIFGGCLILILLFCLFFVPETKGKSLDEVQQMFRSEAPYYHDIALWKCCRGSSEEDRRPIIQDD